jgi:hypothetical protein
MTTDPMTASKQIYTSGMRWYQVAACLALLATGCSHPVSGKPESIATEPRIALNRIYEFKRKGRQLEFNHDTAKRIQWIEVGSKERSTIGDSLRGGSWLYETYAGGRIGLTNGSILKLTTVTLIFRMSDRLESVEGS